MSFAPTMISGEKMGNLLTIIFIAGLYGIWKVLDDMQLPNTISIILVGLVVICGSFWAFYKFSADPRRKAKIVREEKKLGRALNDEEIAQIQPRSALGEFFASLFGVLFIITIIRSFIFEPFQIPSGSMEPTLRVGDFLVVEKYAYGIKDPIFQNTIIPIDKPQRGDVAVFKAPKQPHIDYIKRVVGVSGDKVKYDFRSQELTVTRGDTGEVLTFQYSEGKANPEFFYHGDMQIERTEQGSVTHQILNNPQAFNYAPYFFKQEGQNAGEWVVPEGHYFMMGDNRDNSEDSRFWGFVPEKNMVGKATFIWLSLDKKANEFPTGLRFNRMFTMIK
ncbi:Signal peptidase I [Bibersteinia trehalosi USDA-ARS-USMARC-188]|uniref:Signal peptidase I n=3 Tax=Bibersteinia trehalosi TaxID=47735 RepID=A0A4V7IAG7_BIBTR|nr:Signal peptidase I [Bibersteinia trehalosi USDA-ARS-USMARC-192]AHG82004.1 Signal peptidase I [Bibersteinia trehalosi USDA-ARS-USMARC-188]